MTRKSCPILYHYELLFNNGLDFLNIQYPGSGCIMVLVLDGNPEIGTHRVE